MADDIKRQKRRERYLKNKDKINALRRALRGSSGDRLREQDRARYNRDKPLGKHVRNKEWRSRPDVIEHLKNYRSEWNRRNPDYRSVLKLSSYGMTVEQYDALLKKQKGVCAICRQPEKAFDTRQNKLRRLAVDHHHLTNAVRGLLCTQCNNGIGRFQDDPALLMAAVEYLERFGLFAKKNIAANTPAANPPTP